MSKTTNFDFANKAASTNTVTLTKIGLESNYGVTVHTSNKVVLTNTTCPRDNQEIVILTYNPDMPKVNMEKPTKYPMPVPSGSQFTVELQDYLRISSSDDLTFRQDAPIAAKLSVRASNASEVTDEVILQMIDRLRSIITRDDGTSRVGDLMRGVLEPRED